MPRYLIERRIDGVGGNSEEWLCGISEKSNDVLADLQRAGKHVQWEHSYLTGDAIYCVYVAANPDLVLEHARLGGFPADRIMEVHTIIDPVTGEASVKRQLQSAAASG